MASLNKVILIGNAGKDAELKYMANGTPQAKFSVATTSSRKVGDKWENETEWHNIIMWGDSAERQSQYITKGSPVYVEGRIKTRSWEKDDGTRAYMTEVVADKVMTLGKRESTDDWPTKRAEAAGDLDDLPFE